MSRVLVIFATTDGHTAKVSQAIGQRLRIKGHDAQVLDCQISPRHPTTTMP